MIYFCKCKNNVVIVIMIMFGLIKALQICNIIGMQEEQIIKTSRLITPLQLISTKFRISKRESERRLTQVLKTIIDLKNMSKQCQQDELIRILASDKQKLIDMKRKLSQNLKEQTQIYQICRKRVHNDNYHQKQKKQSKGISETIKQKFHQEIIQYLNCSNKIPQSLVVQKELSLQSLTQIQTNLYEQAFRIANDIETNNLKKLKQWCYENTHMLHKIQSNLQFKLIACQYINILNSNTQNTKAIQFLRKSIQTLTLSSTQKQGIQKLTILLLTHPQTEIDINPHLKEIKKLFMSAFQSIYQVSFTPHLIDTIAIGITSLKSLCCTRPSLINPKICPICQEKINDMSKKLPMLTKFQSSIICRIDGSLMNEANPPIALPNGQVYSLKGLEKISKPNTYFCQTTQTSYDRNACRKVYLT